MNETANYERLLKSFKQYKNMIENFNSSPLYEKNEFLQKNFPHLCSLLFGSHNNPGLLAELIKKDEKGVLLPASPDLQEVIDFLAPSSKKNLFYYIFEYFSVENYQFQKQNLPNYTKVFPQIQMQLKSQDSENSIQKYSSFWDDFKQNKDNFTLKTPDFYFIHLISSFKMLNFSNSHKNLISSAQIQQDEFLFDIQNNPYLNLILQYLQYFSQKNQQNYLDKILFFLEEYFIQDINSKDQRVISSFQDISTPVPHVLELIYIYIHFCQKGNKCTLIQQKQFYQMLLKLFRHFNKDFRNQTTCLSDLGKVWMKYMKPWEMFEKNMLDEILQTYPIFTQQKPNMIKQEEQKQKNELFIKMNVVFFTHLFKEYVISLSSLQVYTPQDVLFFNELVQMCAGTSHDSLLFDDNINKQWLLDLASGKIVKINPQIEVASYLEWMEIQIPQLNLLGDIELSEHIQKIMYNFKMFQYSFVQSKVDKISEYQQVFVMLKQTILQSENVLSTLFKNINFQVQNRQHTFPLDRQSRLCKNFIVGSNKIRYNYNNWAAPLAQGESKIIYWGARLFAQKVDILFGHKGEYPTLQLRFLASHPLIFLLIIFFVCGYLANFIR